MLTITGASDDLVEVDGDIREEFNVYLESNESVVLSVSDGSLIRIIYDEDGIWRLTTLAKGRCSISKVEGDVEQDTFDVMTLNGEAIKWVALSSKEKVAMKDKTE